MMPVPAPLSVLPLTTVVRSLVVTSISSSRLLLPPSLWIMSVLAHTKNPLLNPDYNPLLRMFIKKTFYAQFCAGETHQEVSKTISSLKNMGFTGVVLGYAKEVVLDDKEAKCLVEAKADGDADYARTQVAPWAEGTMETVFLAQPGDFVALKFTGAGRQALLALAEKADPPEAVAQAIDSICTVAAARRVRLLFDAEQYVVQPGIDQWALQYMKKYNTKPGQAVIYGTYQAYLKSTPSTLATHLEAARSGDFTLGVKLVRGAYLGSDARELMYERKEDTDAAYNGIAKSILTRQWGEVLTGSGTFPDTSLVLATHNAQSVQLARTICEAGLARTSIAFAQLQGMADEVSCALVARPRVAGDEMSDHLMSGASANRVGSPKYRAQLSREPLQTYKYLVWGSAGDCMKYLLRRAYENRDAIQRTKSCRDAMWQELARRVRVAIFPGRV